MNSGSSASIASTAQSSLWPATAAAQVTSRPSTIGTSAPVRSNTITVSTGTWAQAASTLALSGMGLPPRRPSSAVTIIVERSEEHTSELQSLMRISYAVLRLKNKKDKYQNTQQ